MPLTRLMRQLSTRLDKRPSGGSLPISAIPSDTRTSHEDELDCGAPPCFVVTAEVRPLSHGQRSTCSSSLSSSGSSSGAPEQQEAVASSVPVGHMASARVLRARNKAAHRDAALGAGADGQGPLLAAPAAAARPCSLPSEALLDCLPLQRAQLQSSGSSCSSMDVQQQQQRGAGAAAAVPYHRAATAPLPLSVPAGSWAARGAAAAAGGQQQQPPPAQEDVEDGGSDDGGSELASPVAPVAFEQQLADDDEHHCEWEDGVVASWLQGLDHPDLDDLHCDDHGHHEGGAEAAAERGGPSALPRGSPPQRALSAMSVGTPATAQMVYSSSLYG